MMSRTDKLLSTLPAGASVRRRGTILITTMMICFTLAIVVLVLGRKMAVEAMASANVASNAQAEEVELGAEQYVLALLTSVSTANGGTYYQVFDTNTYTTDYFAALQVGGQTPGTSADGWFWLLCPVYDGDDDLPLFGLVDEASKLDINYPAGQPIAGTSENAQTEALAYQSFSNLPGIVNMNSDVPAAMIDWADTGDSGDEYQSTGAESTYYSALADPYFAKNAEYDSVDELLMVRDIDRPTLYGDGTASPLGAYSPNLTAGGGPGQAGDPQIARGWYDLLTVDSYSPNTDAPNTPARGKININAAPREVLYCLPNADPYDMDTLISYRTQNSINAGTNDITWVQSAGITNANTLQAYLTGSSNRYSADILAVSHDGRAFKRVRIVINTAGTVTLNGVGTAGLQIVSRRDLTDRGWPMDQSVLESIRRGNGPPDEVGGNNNTVMGH